jgi:rRNA maturation endonuclease Nob1
MLKNVVIEIKYRSPHPGYCNRIMTDDLARQLSALLAAARVSHVDVAVVARYKNHCTVCQEDFESDRFGCCPMCGTPLSEPS